MPLNRMKVSGEGELLTGFVHGKEASDLEERFAKSLDKLGKKYIFEYEVLGPVGIPGQENQIDFVVEDTRPIEVDGNWVHKSGSAKAEDQIRDAILNDFLSQYGWEPIMRISGDQLEDQQQADTVAGELF